MSKSKTRRGGRDFDLLDRLKQDNKRLKRQVHQLRKMVERFDLDRYQNVKELIDSHDRLENQVQSDQAKAEVEKTWTCWECRKGILRLKFLDRRDGAFYYRVCDGLGCKNRTKPQKYVDKKEVEGVE